MYAKDVASPLSLSRSIFFFFIRQNFAREKTNTQREIQAHIHRGKREKKNVDQSSLDVRDVG